MAQTMSFLSGLLQGFGQMSERRQAREQDDAERKARVKLYEIQLQREQAAGVAQQQQMDARTKLLSMLGGSAAPATPPNGLPDAQGPVAAPGGGGPASLTSLLADPKAAMLLLQSGMLKGEDVLKQEQSTANRAMLEKLMGGGGAANGMEMQGLKVGPSGEVMPDFGLPQLTTQTFQTPDGARIQSKNPRSGALVADLGAAKEDTATPEQAGRISGLMQARQLSSEIRSALVRGDGTVDNMLVFNMFSKTPFSKGREIRQKMDTALDAVIRARSGSGLNKEELPDVRAQLLPNPLDSDAAKIAKLDNLDKFVNGSLDVVTLPPRIRKLLEKNTSTSGWSIQPVH